VDHWNLAQLPAPPQNPLGQAPQDDPAQPPEVLLNPPFLPHQQEESVAHKDPLGQGPQDDPNQEPEPQPRPPEESVAHEDPSGQGPQDDPNQKPEPQPRPPEEAAREDSSTNPGSQDDQSPVKVSAVPTTDSDKKGLSVVQRTQEAMPPEESPAAATTTTASSLKRPPEDSSSPANTKNHETMDVSTPNDLPRQVVCQHAYADRSHAATRQEQDGNSHQRVYSLASDAFSLNLSREGTSPFEASPNDSLGTPFSYFAGQSVDGRGLAHGMATFGTPYRSICDNKQANQESSAVASQMQQGSIGDTPNQESSFKTPQKNESFKNKEKSV
jgi:hypothetical protein